MKTTKKIENKSDIANASKSDFCEIGLNLSARMPNISNNNLELPDGNP